MFLNKTLIFLALSFLYFGKFASFVVDSCSMITPLQSLILGIVQGLSEFLPISSSAHLILVPSYMHWRDPGLAFDVALHLGTLLALFIYFWKDITGFAFALVHPDDPDLAPS